MNEYEPFAIFDKHFHNIDDILKEKTVFFLGAGSSNPYGLPLGTSLQKEMAANSNSPILVKSGFSNEERDDFNEALRYNKYNTIDEFLEKKTRFRKIGSYTIALTILSRENNDKLFLQRDWYGGLFDSLDFEREIPNIKNLSIVTLNYDRSLEHFLSSSIEHNCYDGTIDLSRTMLSFIKIFHPHGNIGNLTEVEYGAKNLDLKLLKVASNNIRITSDDLSKTTDFKNSIIALRKAKNIIFLGFGYDKNVLIKYFNDTIEPDKKYFGTAMNIQPKRAEEIKSFFENAISLDNKNNTCDLYLKRIGVIS